MSVPTVSERLGFAGHETFAFRHGWLKKAVDAVRFAPRALSSDSAIVELGVGKNMVESIRHWGLATQILADVPQYGLQVTEIGNKLLEEWDPFLEDSGSVWLLHWLLVSNPARAATWHLAFSSYPRPDFTKVDLVQSIVNAAERRGTTARLSTISRDVDCLIRMYVPLTSSAKLTQDDTFDCPLTDLTLITGPRDGDLYRFSVGPKRSLPTEVFGYALLHFTRRAAVGRQTLGIGDCMYSPGSPGQAFKLDENSFVQYVEDLAELSSGAIQFDDTSGLRQVYIRETTDPLHLLTAYYEIEGGR